jgi:hypothetical protein
MTYNQLLKKLLPLWIIKFYCGKQESHVYVYIYTYMSYGSSIIACPSFPQVQKTHGGQGRLIIDVSRSHAMTHHSRQDSSGRGIGPSQRPLPDNTQHSQETDFYAPTGFEPAIPATDSLLRLFGH